MKPQFEHFRFSRSSTPRLRGFFLDRQRRSPSQFPFFGALGASSDPTVLGSYHALEVISDLVEFSDVVVMSLESFKKLIRKQLYE